LREVNTVKNKLETTQSYHQAKYVLMAKGHLEESAHQVILKVAMDEQITKQAACLKIIAENAPSGLQKKREASIIND
jgi:AmiR/NasT family two-component response regulator